MCSTHKRNGRVLGRRTPGGGPRRGGRDPRPLGHPPRQRRTPGNEPRDIRSISNPTVLHVPRLLAGQCERQTAATPHLRKGRKAEAATQPAWPPSTWVDLGPMRPSGLEPPRRKFSTRPSTRSTRRRWVQKGTNRPFCGVLGTHRTYLAECLLSDFCHVSTRAAWALAPRARGDQGCPCGAAPFRARHTRCSRRVARPL
jgi:hypothetical protein